MATQKHLTEVAGLRRTRPSSVSAGASLPYTYDQAMQAYNVKLSNTKTLRRALARGLSGFGLSKLVIAGDSTVKGVGVSNQATSSAVAYLTALLEGEGYKIAGTGLVPAYSGTGPEDTRWTFTAGWGNFTAPIKQSNGVGNIATFVSDRPGTEVVIGYLNNNTASQFTYQIDSLAAVTVTPTAAQTVSYLTVSGLADTTHTVKITSLSATATYLVGIEVRRTTGISITKMGIGGATAANYAATSWYGPRRIIQNYVPDAILFQMETNDVNNSTATASYATDMTTAVGWLKELADVTLLTAYPIGAAATLTPYTDALYAVANTLDLPVVDFVDRWGSYAEANANGYMADSLHPNAAGYADGARALRQLLR